MSGFQFKQFFIAHDRCAMKVNTDGVLLGALAEVTNAKQILDLGTGTGLVAIMLAQRTAEAQITAIELDPQAADQALVNAQHSPWAARITVLEQDVLQFRHPVPFDLIVANPPYFLNSLNAPNNERNLARHSLQAHSAWLLKATELLTSSGKICFILPTEAAMPLCTQAKSLNLHCIERVEICTKIGKTPKRVILTFSPLFIPMHRRNVIIYDAQNRYTKSFKILTADFYLMH